MEEIGKSLPIIFKRQLRRDEPQLADILAPLWPRVAGRAIAEHSRPVAFASGELTLETSCQTWAEQLRQMQTPIAEAVNRYLGTPSVKALRVRVRANAPAWDSKRQLKLHEPDSREPLIAGFEARPGPEGEASGTGAPSAGKTFASGVKRPD